MNHLILWFTIFPFLVHSLSVCVRLNCIVIIVNVSTFIMAKCIKWSDSNENWLFSSFTQLNGVLSSIHHGCKSQMKKKTLSFCWILCRTLLPLRLHRRRANFRINCWSSSKSYGSTSAWNSFKWKCEHKFMCFEFWIFINYLKYF